MEAYNKLSQFDIDGVEMLKSITKQEVTVTEQDHTFLITVPADKVPDYLHRPLIVGAKGRWGDRVKSAIERDALIAIEVKYSENDPPAKMEKTEPHPDCAELYCRTIAEVRAMQVDRVAVNNLKEFTGGGVMEIPRTPGGIAKYSFLTQNGVIMEVPERWWIIYADGSFSAMDDVRFAREFERKNGNR